MPHLKALGIRGCLVMGSMDYAVLFCGALSRIMDLVSRIFRSSCTNHQLAMFGNIVDALEVSCLPAASGGFILYPPLHWFGPQQPTRDLANSC